MFGAFKVAANSTTAGKEGGFGESFCCNKLMYKLTVSLKPTGLPCHPEPSVMFRYGIDLSFLVFLALTLATVCMLYSSCLLLAGSGVPNLSQRSDACRICTVNCISQASQCQQAAQEGCCKGMTQPNSDYVN